MKTISLKGLAGKLSNIGSDIWPGASKNANSTNLGELCQALLQLEGEASSVAIAEEILSNYQSSNNIEKLNFFKFLFDELSADPKLVDEAIKRYQSSKGQQQLYELGQTIEAPRQELFRTLNMAKDGTRSLISLREDLSCFLSENPNLKAIDQDLFHLFNSWFNRGFLELRHIDWHTPAEILEKLIKYESVHEIQGWPDLRRRLESDRRCFGFFHPAMPNEPLIFVEVALTHKLYENVANIIDQDEPEENPEKAFNTAVFYSINNCFSGLRGVSFGNFLIKQVVENLAAEMPEITTYCTLSPVPGFVPWLEHNINDLTFLAEAETAQVSGYLLGTVKHEEVSAALLQLCAYYLIKVKKGKNPANPVARFHLGNGACLQQINWGADLSENGLKQSAGIMVNYLYDKKTLTRNHEAYLQHHKVTCASQVNKLLP